MYGLLIFIYLFLGMNWGQRYLLLAGGSWSGLISNVVFWPVFMLITMVSCLILRPNYVIKEEEL
jgi:hypothetical protein